MRRTTTAAWFSFEIIALASVWAARLDAAAAQPGSSLEHRFGYLVGSVFALMGALILTYRPENHIGWLLILLEAPVLFNDTVRAWLAGKPLPTQLLVVASNPE